MINRNPIGMWAICLAWMISLPGACHAYISVALTPIHLVRQSEQVLVLDAAMSDNGDALVAKVTPQVQGNAREGPGLAARAAG